MKMVPQLPNQPSSMVTTALRPKSYKTLLVEVKGRMHSRGPRTPSDQDQRYSTPFEIPDLEAMSKTKGQDLSNPVL